MNKKAIILIGLFILIVFIINGGGKKSEIKQEASLQKQPTWQEIKSWEGSGDKNTKSFIIKGTKWRVRYSFMDTSGVKDLGLRGGTFAVFVAKPGIGEIDSVVNTLGSVEDVSYLYRKGEFYLKIIANGDWEISVEDFK